MHARARFRRQTAIHVRGGTLKTLLSLAALSLAGCSHLPRSNTAAWGQGRCRECPHIHKAGSRAAPVQAVHAPPGVPRLIVHEWERDLHQAPSQSHLHAAFVAPPSSDRLMGEPLPVLEPEHVVDSRRHAGPVSPIPTPARHHDEPPPRPLAPTAGPSERLRNSPNLLIIRPEDAPRPVAVAEDLPRLASAEEPSAGAFLPPLVFEEPLVIHD